MQERGIQAEEERPPVVAIEEQMMSSEEGETQWQMADAEPVEIQVVNRRAERKQGVKADMSVRYKQLLDQDT